VRVADAPWNRAAFRMLGLRPTGIADPGLPAAVGEWFAAGADRLLAEVVDDFIPTLADPRGERFREAGFLLLETDSQHCCEWVVALGDDDNPVVYLVDPDDFSCASRARYAESFTAYTEATVFDTRVMRPDSLWSFDHVLGPDAVAELSQVLRPGPTTYGWAHNQGCDATYRFSQDSWPEVSDDADVQVSMAVAGSTALWTVTYAPDPIVRTMIADIIGIPARDG
jgi:hypothetical protein